MNYQCAVLACLWIFLGCRSAGKNSVLQEEVPNARFTPAELDALKIEFSDEYAADFSQLGGPFRVQFFRSIPSLYSFATIKNGAYEVAIMGGNLNKSTMSTDSLRLLVCHEIGHFLGGAPKRILLDPEEDQAWNTVEGGADYYATLKCMKRLLAKQTEQNRLALVDARPEIVEACLQNATAEEEQLICVRTALAAEKLVRFFAISANSPLVPQIENPDSSEVPKTLFAHPGLQCRLDTFWAGILCQASVKTPLDDKDTLVGACGEDAAPFTQRPRCWYREADFMPSKLPSSAL